MAATYHFYYQLDAELNGRLEIRIADDGWQLAMYVSARKRTWHDCMYAADDSEPISNQLYLMTHAATATGAADAWKWMMKHWPSYSSLGFQIFAADGELVHEYLPE